MKSFFSHRFKHWKSPLEVFPLVADKNPHLFFSGATENPEISGDFSFIPFQENYTKHKIVKKNPEKNNLDWQTIQKIFLKDSSDYKSDATLKNWKFPFCGGIAGVFSYDFVRELEKIPENKKMNISVPLAALEIYETFFAFDHKDQEFFVAGWFENEISADVFFEEMKIFCRDKNMSRDKKFFVSTVENKFVSTNLEKTVFSPEISVEEYEKKFQICQDEIEKGNSFQINFSQKFLGNSSDSAWDIFLAATEKNPAQMMYFHEQWRKDLAIISCSPERLFSCDRNNKIFTQPIAGTRPRGKNVEEEKNLESELVTSVKEISEHSMIVDLLRNDFGKISAFGSVQVEKFMRVEKYATVMHLVSDITGIIAPEKNIFDVFTSLFPGGTITGTPKTETMKILAREEVSSRNFYCGSAGYFSFCGSADWNILIRTLEKEGEEISGRAGGGLVYGADPKNEYQETLHKFSGIQKIFE